MSIFQCKTINQQFFFIIIGIWIIGNSIGCQEKQEKRELNGTAALCSYLEDKVNQPSVCESSSSDLGVIEKVNLKGKIKEENKEDVSSIQSHNVESITEVDLSDNPDLTSLPDFVMNIPNLTQLNISNTGISDFGSEICQLEKLEKLIGKNNSYKDNEIPFHTFCIKNLKVLDMSNSNIRYIDEYVGTLSHLEELHVSNNQLEIIPLMLSTLPHLVLVDFRQNNLKEKELNTLQSCKGISEEGDKEDCREDLADSIECEFLHELPFQRGEPLRKIYTDLAGQNLCKDNSKNIGKACPMYIENCNHLSSKEEREKCYLNKFESTEPEQRDLLHRDPCYLAWVVWIVDYDESPHLLNKTIRGKTIRELRYASEYQSTFFNKFFLCGYGNRWPWRYFSNIDKPKKMPALPFEAFPEQFRKPGLASKIKASTSNVFLDIDVKDWGIPQCDHLPDLREYVDRRREKQRGD